VLGVLGWDVKRRRLEVHSEKTSPKSPGEVRERPDRHPLLVPMLSARRSAQDAGSARRPSPTAAPDRAAIAPLGPRLLHPIVRIVPYHRLVRRICDLFPIAGDRTAGPFPPERRGADR
jgi:hypothetical protein